MTHTAGRAASRHDDGRAEDGLPLKSVSVNSHCLRTTICLPGIVKPIFREQRKPYNATDARIIVRVSHAEF